jgi:N-acetylglucosaminyldiphosphoundecaprenol N-acetyl-beta-D-mannosaminyltransferase
MNKKVQLFGAFIDVVRMPQAVATLMEWIKAGANGRCHYVVTPNVDHTRLLHESAAFRDAYAVADMTLADGMPVVWASRLLGKPLPERVTGADLVPALFSAADESRPLRVFLLGALPGVADRAAAKIMARWQHVYVSGTYSPPFGFEKDAKQNNDILSRIAAAKCDVVVVGLGAPKQELWVHAHRERIEARVALCVGATIDFLAGEVRRAPLWVQSAGLEWCYRLLSEPRRLFRRYAQDALLFPQLVWAEFAHRQPQISEANAGAAVAPSRSTRR